MDGVDPSYEHANAVAGPSSITQDAPIFLPPPMALSQPQGFLTSTQDLLARFRLHAAYCKHVRVPLDSSIAPPATPAQSNLSPPPDLDEKKKKNSYRHLIKTLPGKHSMKKDDYLVTIMQAPPKQHIPIVPFDVKTQKEAFTVSAEGLKGWNAGALILESAQAREDRKKRVSITPSLLDSDYMSYHPLNLQKKLARAQAQGLTPGSLPGTPTAFPQPQPTPSHPTIPSAQQPPGTSQTSQAKPRVAPVTIPPPGSVGQSTSTPMSATPRSVVPTTALPQRTNTSMPGRGQKRELEDGVIQPPTPTSLSPNVPIGIVGARAGVGNVRPRPIKKQRMDMQGQSREVLVQQPTPQGS
ncbi:hypothetical protein J3R83DRAFT_12272 [Lanmaoa asiatica]|nr:hypothetical protein J3R83DRAFT_12272 [Lanmaoa asiatica]